MRTPILKTCSMCNGDGCVSFLRDYGSTTGVTMEFPVCPKCDGRGHEETDMFVEVPDEPFLSPNGGWR